MTGHRDPSAGRVQETAQILTRAERSLTRRITEALGDVTVERWRVLVLLADGAGHPMSEIALFAMVPAPSLTRLIDRMVNDNLVYRTTDPADGRRVLVHIAPRGERQQRELAQRVEGLRDTILDPTVDHLDELIALLTRVVDRIEQTGGATSPASGTHAPV